ncbi:MAG: hypothetical protein PHT71_07830 [Victivallaceae bacterium]|nr:hypothetical protein [Victivallaceae bacterium]
MKCQFWTTIFKLLLPLTAPALSIDADIAIRDEANSVKATATVCKIKLEAVAQNGGWLIQNISGDWNSNRININQPFQFPASSPIAPHLTEVLNCLLPYAAEKIDVPSSEGCHKLDNAFVRELLTPYGFAVEKMSVDAEWRIKPNEAQMSIKGSGLGQKIEYLMILRGKIRNVKFTFRIESEIGDGTPLTDGIKINRSGSGTIKITF